MDQVGDHIAVFLLIFDVVLLVTATFALSKYYQKYLLMPLRSLGSFVDLGLRVSPASRYSYSEPSLE